MTNASLKASFFLVALAAAAIGCASRSPRYYWPGAGVTASGRDLDTIIAANPLGSEANMRVVNLGRTAETSHHLVQVRHGEPLHIHRDHDLTVIVARGHGTMRLGGRSFAVTAGDAVFVPRAVPHAFLNGSRQPAAALVIFTPPFDGKDTIAVQETE